MATCTLLTAQTDGKQDLKGDSVRLMYSPKWEKVLKRTPQDQKKWQDFELFARMYAKYAIPEEKVLPIVFHVIDIGGKRKITEAMIYEQINILNNAFAGRLEGSSSKVFDAVKAGDSKIKFCVGSPNGKNAGIDFTNKAQNYDVDRLAQISDKKDGLPAENKDNYINIWITEMPGSMAGYAVLPGHDQGDDGIYIDPDFFASQRESKYYKAAKPWYTSWVAT